MADFMRDYVSYPTGVTFQNNPDPFHRASAQLPLGIGDFLFSATRAFRVGLQPSDGNLLLWNIDDGDLPLDITRGHYRHALWDAGSQGGHSWVMQSDGNLVVYNVQGAQGSPTWASNTQGNPGAFLRLQDDGNLVIYTQDGRALWSSNTFAGKR